MNTEGLLKRIEALERELGLHEGGWVQLLIDRRVIWLTSRAYGACYLALDHEARARVDRAFLSAIRSRWELADLECLSR